MRKLIVFLGMVLVFGVVGTANAALTKIGTASYNDGINGLQSYNLIYEDDSLNGGLVWLDYYRNSNEWQEAIDWASGLGGNLTVTLDPGYTTDIDWSTGWRLPITDESQGNFSGGYGWEGPDASGYHDYIVGYNMVNSELGHLYYVSLGNLGYMATDGTSPQPGYGLENEGDFINLWEDPYWSGTEISADPDFAWVLEFETGEQNGFTKNSNPGTLAVHSGTVSAVPIPSAVWFLGSGLIALVGFRKFRNE